MKGAFLRTDWVAALVLALCAVRAKRPAVGGALVPSPRPCACFPCSSCWGSWSHGLPRAPAARAAALRHRFRSDVRPAAGPVGTGRRARNLAGCADKIWQHHDSFSPWRVGFKHLFLGTYEYLPDGNTHQEVFRQRWLPWWTLQGLMLAGLAFMTRRLETWETLALGFVPVFFLVAPTYYYYIMLVIPLLFFCGRLPRHEGALGVAWLLGSSSIAYVVEEAVGRELPLFYTLSLIVFTVCVLMSVSAWRTCSGPHRVNRGFTPRLRHDKLERSWPTARALPPPPNRANTAICRQVRARRSCAKRTYTQRRKAPASYVELHMASAFSFLDGSSQPEDLVERAAALGLGAVALADRNGVLRRAALAQGRQRSWRQSAGRSRSRARRRQASAAHRQRQTDAARGEPPLDRRRTPDIAGPQCRGVSQPLQAVDRGRPAGAPRPAPAPPGRRSPTTRPASTA